jgi:RNA polymerase sigma-70 factor (ECF subfamily)
MMGSLGFRVQDSSQISEQNRHRLRGLAYRLLGSPADADDMVQDTYIRWHEAEIRRRGNWDR